jgi:hypothetical protein
MARNYKVYQIPLLTSMQGFNLLFYNASQLEKYEFNITLEDARARLIRRMRFSSDNPLVLSNEAQKVGIKRIMESPLKYIFLHIKCCIRLLFSTKTDDFLLRMYGEKIWISELLNVFRSERSVLFKSLTALLAFLEVSLVFLFTIIGIIEFIRSPRLPNLLFFVVFIYFFILPGVTDARFRLPLIPYVYLLSASFIFKQKLLKFIVNKLI